MSNKLEYKEFTAELRDSRTILCRDLYKRAATTISRLAEELDKVTLKWFAVAEYELPDVNNEDHETKVWARWDDGEVEPAIYVNPSMNVLFFQRKCGTNEGAEGWDGNVGYVTHWAYFETPQLPWAIAKDL